MNTAAQITFVIVALALAYLPLGKYMAHIFSSDQDTRLEKWIYRVCRINPRSEQRWSRYYLSVLTFSAVSVLALYALQRLQNWLPLAHGHAPVSPAQAWNTAVSFVTNTNWQSYAGETTMTNLTQMAGLAVQNFLSAAVGLAVAVALIRSLARQNTPYLGNFWVDLTRAVLRLLLPIAAVAATILIANGVVQTFASSTDITTLTGAHQTITLGPVASQEAIKELGTNGGGFFNANSAHPFENPNAFTNLLEIILILMIPTSLTRTYGIMVGDKRQGWAVLGAMTTIFAASLAIITWAEMSNTGSAIRQAGAALEGKEMRFGVGPSALFATATTLTSTGAVDSFHSSYSGIGQAMELINMQLGEIAPGGVGSGLYGMLIVAILAVFIAGLMVGRTPEYLGKRIGPTQIKLVSLYTLIMPALVLIGVGIAIYLPAARASILNPGPHGLTEILYAFTSAGNNNGSAFAGLNANTYFYNLALGMVMLLGRFLPMLCVLALAGTLAQQQKIPPTSGTLTTHTPLFMGVMVGVAILISGLTFVPVLALGPLAEGLL